MADGPSKINPPNSHPSNPIHKVAIGRINRQTTARERGAYIGPRTAKNRAYGSRNTATRNKQNSYHHWCDRPRGFVVYGMVLMPF